MTYSKYSSHYESSCNDAEYNENNIISSITERDYVTKRFKKQEKYWDNNLRRS